MQESPELRSLVLWFYEVLANRDFAALEHFIAKEDGALYLGSDPDEWWVGHDTVVAKWRLRLEELGEGFRIEAGEPHAYAEGNIGFAADRPLLVLPGGLRVQSRFTGVFMLEGGLWTMLHGHASIGIPNDQALGRRLAT
jgi:SnoaL-like domain